MDKREFTATGRILCDPIGQRKREEEDDERHGGNDSNRGA